MLTQYLWLYACGLALPVLSIRMDQTAGTEQSLTLKEGTPEKDEIIAKLRQELEAAKSTARTPVEKAGKSDEM